MKISRLPLSLCALMRSPCRSPSPAAAAASDEGARRRRGRRRRRGGREERLRRARSPRPRRATRTRSGSSRRRARRSSRRCKNQAVQFLVQREQFEQEADALDVEITEKQVDARLEQIQKQYFGGDKKKFDKQLKDQGLTEAQVRKDIRSQIVSEKIFEEVTGEVKVTDKQVEEYYNKNKAQYSQPESREVRHILVKTQREGGRHLQPAEGRRRLRARWRRSSPRTPVRRRTAAS